MRSAGLTFALLAPVLAASQPPAASPAPPRAACGIVPWTGSCACDVQGAVVGFARYAALLRATGSAAAETALRAEQRSCRLPDSAAASRSAALPVSAALSAPPG